MGTKFKYRKKCLGCNKIFITHHGGKYYCDVCAEKNGTLAKNSVEEKLKKKILELEEEVLYYKKLQEKAFENYQNKNEAQKRLQEQIKIEKNAEKNTRSYSQKIRREEERKIKAVQKQTELRKKEFDYITNMAKQWEEAINK